MSENKLDQEPNEEVKTEKPVRERTVDESSLPLFLRNSSDGDKGNAQDEKDETGE
jgi:hypothetical protein